MHEKAVQAGAHLRLPRPPMGALSEPVKNFRNRLCSSSSSSFTISHSHFTACAATASEGILHLPCTLTRREDPCSFNVQATCSCCTIADLVAPATTQECLQVSIGV